MPVRYTCPNCTTTLVLASPARPGTKARCPNCQSVFALREQEIPLVEAVGADEPRQPASGYTILARRPAEVRSSRNGQDEGGAIERAAGPRETRAVESSGSGYRLALLASGVAVLFLLSVIGGISIVLWFLLAAPAPSGAPSSVVAQEPKAAGGAAGWGGFAPREEVLGQDVAKEERPKTKAAPPPRSEPAKTGDREMDRLLFDLEAVDGAIRKAATDRLIAMKPNQHRAVVARKLAEQLPFVEPFQREPFIHALSVWATPAEVPALIWLLDTPEIYIRNITLDALGKLRDEQAVKPVVQCFKEFNTRWHAEQALKALGPMAEGEVLGLLEQPQREMWVPAIYVLAEIGTEKSMPTLREASMHFEMKGVAEGAMMAIQKRMRK